MEILIEVYFIIDTGATTFFVRLSALAYAYYFETTRDILLNFDTVITNITDQSIRYILSHKRDGYSGVKH